MTNEVSPNKMDEQQLAYQYEAISAKLEEGKRQLVSLERTIVQVKEALMVVENLPKEKALFSLGGGVYADVSGINNSSLLTAIGAGAYAFKPRDESVAILKERLVELEKAFAMIQKSLGQLIQQQQAIEQMLGQRG